MRKYNYLSNKNLIPQIMHYKETGEATEEFGSQLLLLAKQISNKPSFIGYTWKEDMISFAVYTCLKRAKGFDPEKSDNPFSYLTSIIINAFKAYLNVQKKHSNIKKECYNKMHLVNENDSYKSINYNELKKWDELKEENKIKEYNMVCVECGIAQTIDIYLDKDINLQNQEIINKSQCIECKGITICQNI